METAEQQQISCAATLRQWTSWWENGLVMLLMLTCRSTNGQDLPELLKKRDGKMWPSENGEK